MFFYYELMIRGWVLCAYNVHGASVLMEKATELCGNGKMIMTKIWIKSTLLGTNISTHKGILESMIFLFPRWDTLVPWRVLFIHVHYPLSVGMGRTWLNRLCFSCWTVYQDPSTRHFSNCRKLRHSYPHAIHERVNEQVLVLLDTRHPVYCRQYLLNNWVVHSVLYIPGG